MKPVQVALLTALTLTLTGCSTIKSAFPDKEKDYQFTSEIPELVVPADLKDNNKPKPVNKTASIRPATEKPAPKPDKPAVAAPAPAKKPPTSQPAPSQPAAAVETDNEQEQLPAAILNIPSPGVALDEPQTAPSLKPAELIDDNNSLRLKIFEPRLRAWRMVGKALSRQGIEILQRNPSRSDFMVRYTPNPQPISDDSIWDEILFVATLDNNEEQTFRIHLSEINPQLTEVVLLDDEDQLTNSRLAKQLLTAIKETLNLTQGKP